MTSRFHDFIFHNFKISRLQAREANLLWIHDFLWSPVRLRSNSTGAPSLNAKFVKCTAQKTSEIAASHRDHHFHIMSTTCTTQGRRRFWYTYYWIAVVAGWNVDPFQEIRSSR